jgi:hypothetical protein
MFCKIARKPAIDAPSRSIFTPQARACEPSLLQERRSLVRARQSENLNRIAALEIINQVLNRNARTGETRCAAHDFGIDFDNGLTHATKFRIKLRPCKQSCNRRCAAEEKFVSVRTPRVRAGLAVACETPVRLSLRAGSALPSRFATDPFGKLRAGSAATSLFAARHPFEKLRASSFCRYRKMCFGWQPKVRAGLALTG